MIPDDIRRYLVQCVPSVPYIEAALLMRENRKAEWQPDLLARRLYLGTDEATRLLFRLHADGLVSAAAAGYRFAPASEDLEKVWEQLAVVYAHHLIEVSTLIHTKPSGTAQILAEAFVWRKDK